MEVPDQIVSVSTLTSPTTGETYADVGDLIALFEDARQHPKKYNREAVIALAEQVTGKKLPVTIERPF